METQPNPSGLLLEGRKRHGSKGVFMMGNWIHGCRKIRLFYRLFYNGIMQFTFLIYKISESLKGVQRTSGVLASIGF